MNISADHLAQLIAQVEQQFQQANNNAQALSGALQMLRQLHQQAVSGIPQMPPQGVTGPVA